MWHYLYFLILIKVKDKTEFTGPESFVYSCIQNKNLEWFPRMRAMSLDDQNKIEEENEIHHLKSKLEMTSNLMVNLNKQVEELKEMVRKFREMDCFFKKLDFISINSLR
jgi:hypothetical protein